MLLDEWLNNNARRPFWLSLAFVAALYGGTLSFGFAYDDVLLIKPYSWSELLPFLYSPWSERFYRPLVNFFFSLQYSIFGQTSWAYHSVNLLLTALVLYLYQRILYRLSIDATLAFASALLWLILPGNAVIVTWISAQIDLLALLFALSSWLFFVEATDRDRLDKKMYIFSLLFAVLAYASKEISVTLPLMFTAYLVLFRRVSSRQLFRHLLIHYLLWIAYFVWRAFVLGARTVGEQGFSKNAWVAEHPLAGLTGMAVRYVEALISTLYPVFLIPGWLSAFLLFSAVIWFLVAGWRQKNESFWARPWLWFTLVWWAMAALPNMLDASPRLLSMPTLAMAAMLVSAFHRLFINTVQYRTKLILAGLIFCFVHIHMNGLVQACFTQPVYLSTLKYDSNDRRRWPFSDLRNLRHEIRQTLLHYLDKESQPTDKVQPKM